MQSMGIKGIIGALGVVGSVVFGLITLERSWDEESELRAQVLSHLDEEALDFAKSASSLSQSNQCLPVIAASKDGINSFYMHCSKDALENESQEERISENFTVPAALSRRFHFWERVYSLWGHDQHIIHAANYPEVVFEIIDGAHARDYGSPNVDKETKRLLKERIAAYRVILDRLDRQQRNSRIEMSPAMQRVADTMAHIQDKRKYRIAYLTIRSQLGQREFVRTGLVSSQSYMPKIEEIFLEQGLPTELANLAFVESSFNLQAYSKVGASGVYQLMPGTARQYGLIVEEDIDERRDPIKSARVAAKLLQTNFRLTQNWGLAVTAYNHGLGGIKQAMKKARSVELDEIIDRFQEKSFGFASENFYCEFLAMVKTVRNSGTVFGELATVAPLQFKEIKLQGRTSIKQLEKKYGVTLAEVGRLNPDISRSWLTKIGILPGGYRVKIPDRTAETLAASQLVRADVD